LPLNETAYKQADSPNATKGYQLYTNPRITKAYALHHQVSQTDGDGSQTYHTLGNILDGDITLMNNRRPIILPY
jgi:hypothetical protein